MQGVRRLARWKWGFLFSTRKICQAHRRGRQSFCKVIRSKEDTNSKYTPQFDSFTRYYRPLRTPVLRLSCPVLRLSDRHYNLQAGTRKGCPYKTRFRIRGIYYCCESPKCWDSTLSCLKFRSSSLVPRLRLGNTST